MSEAGTESPGGVMAAMLYADRDHRPTQKLLDGGQLLLVGGIGLVEVLHLGAEAASFGRVMKEFGTSNAETHERSLLALENTGEAMAEVELRTTLLWSDVTRVRFERTTVTLAAGETERSIYVPHAAPVLEAIRAALPSFTTVEVRRPRREILVDVARVFFASAVLGLLISALCFLLSLMPMLAGLDDYVFWSGWVPFVAIMALTTLGTLIRLLRPAGLIELRPREADSGYR